jgi:hypothetical protein
MPETDESKKVRSNIVLEILGKPKEHVQEAIKLYIEKIKSDENKDTVILDEKIHDVVEQKDGFFSTFAELQIISKDISALIGFCFDYMPSSVEIIAPENIDMSHREMANVLNDLQAKLHTLDMTIKTTRTENDFLKRNMNTLIRNMVMVSLKHKPMDLNGLSKLTGIKSDELKLFLERLIKLDKLKEENNIYFLKNE